MSDPTITALERLGLKVPERLAEAVALRDNLEAEASDYVGKGRPELIPLQRYVDRLSRIDAEAGVAGFRHAVHEMVTADAARTLWAKASPVLDKRVHDALIESGDELIEEARGRFTEAVAEARPLLELFGSQRPDAESAILAGTVDEFQRYDSAVAELKKAATIVDVLGGGSQVLDASSHTYRRRSGYYGQTPLDLAYLADDLDLDAFEEAAAAYEEGGVAALVAAGYDVTLRTGEEAQACWDALQAEKRDRDRQAARAEEDTELTPTQKELSRSWAAHADRVAAARERALAIHRGEK